MRRQIDFVSERFNVSLDNFGIICKVVLLPPMSVSVCICAYERRVGGCRLSTRLKADVLEPR